MGPTTGIQGDENSVFQGENTAEIMVTLKEDSPISSETVIETIDNMTIGC